MAITGGPLILAAVLATLAALAGTVGLWHRGGRWRPSTRTAGVLLCEGLLVLSAGLVVNRLEDFYPSWPALAGDTGPGAATAARAAGSLDTSFGPGTLRVAWQPAGSAAWHLHRAATVTVPPDYPGARTTFPALVALGAQPAPAELVEVALRPGAGPVPAGLPELLSTATRVTGHGWALVTVPASAPLADRLVRENPGRFAALAVAGPPPAGFRCPAGVTVAVAAAPGIALPCHAVRLSGSWAAAAGWAVAQTPPALAAPRVLPVAAGS